MKKISVFTFLLFAFISIYSQNIITNSSFESTVSCPTGGSQINTTLNWYAYRWSPDHFNSCAVNQPGGVSVPYNAYGYQQAATGNAYVGIFTYGSSSGDTVLREYLGAQLPNPLSTGQKYYVSLKVNSSSNLNMNCRTNNIGALFSTISFKDPSDENLNVANKAPIRNFAHVYTASIISDTVNWITISGSFTADSAYNYIIIGNFFDNQQTLHTKIDNSPSCLAYYFVDDICVSTDSMTCKGITGISEFDNKSISIKIYPNPAQQSFTIELPQHQNFNLLVYDVTGRKVYQRTNATGIIKVDCSSFTSGMYFIQAVNEKTVLSGKLIKQ